MLCGPAWAQSGPTSSQSTEANAQPSGQTDSTGQPVRYSVDNKEDGVAPEDRPQNTIQRPGTLSDDRSGFGLQRGDPRPPGTVGAASIQPPDASGTTSGSGQTATGNITGNGSTAGEAPGAIAGSGAGGAPGAITNAGTKGQAGSGH